MSATPGSTASVNNDPYGGQSKAIFRPTNGQPGGVSNATPSIQESRPTSNPSAQISVPEPNGNEQHRRTNATIQYARYCQVDDDMRRDIYDDMQPHSVVFVAKDQIDQQSRGPTKLSHVRGVKWINTQMRDTFDLMPASALQLLNIDFIGQACPAMPGELPVYSQGFQPSCEDKLAWESYYKAWFDDHAFRESVDKTGNIKKERLALLKFVRHVFRHAIGENTSYGTEDVTYNDDRFRKDAMRAFDLLREFLMRWRFEGVLLTSDVNNVRDDPHGNLSGDTMEFNVAIRGPARVRNSPGKASDTLANAYPSMTATNIDPAFYTTHPNEFGHIFDSRPCVRDSLFVTLVAVPCDDKGIPTASRNPQTAGFDEKDFGDEFVDNAVKDQMGKTFRRKFDSHIDTEEMTKDDLHLQHTAVAENTLIRLEYQLCSSRRLWELRSRATAKGRTHKRPYDVLMRSKAGDGSASHDLRTIASMTMIMSAWRVGSVTDAKAVALYPETPIGRQLSAQVMVSVDGSWLGLAALRARYGAGHLPGYSNEFLRLVEKVGLNSEATLLQSLSEAAGMDVISGSRALKTLQQWLSFTDSSTETSTENYMFTKLQEAVKQENPYDGTYTVSDSFLWCLANGIDVKKSNTLKDRNGTTIALRELLPGMQLRKLDALTARYYKKDLDDSAAKIAFTTGKVNDQHRVSRAIRVLCDATALLRRFLPHSVVADNGILGWANVLQTCGIEELIGNRVLRYLNGASANRMTADAYTNENVLACAAIELMCASSISTQDRMAMAPPFGPAGLARAIGRVVPSTNYLTPRRTQMIANQISTSSRYVFMCLGRALEQMDGNPSAYNNPSQLLVDDTVLETVMFALDTFGTATSRADATKILMGLQPSTSPMYQLQYVLSSIDRDELRNKVRNGTDPVSEFMTTKATNNPNKALLNELKSPDNNTKYKAEKWNQIVGLLQSLTKYSQNVEKRQLENLGDELRNMNDGEADQVLIDRFDFNSGGSGSLLDSPVPPMAPGPSTSSGSTSNTAPILGAMPNVSAKPSIQSSIGSRIGAAVSSAYSVLAGGDDGAGVGIPSSPSRSLVADAEMGEAHDVAVERSGRSESTKDSGKQKRSRSRGGDRGESRPRASRIKPPSSATSGESADASSNDDRSVSPTMRSGSPTENLTLMMPPPPPPSKNSGKKKE